MDTKKLEEQLKGVLYVAVGATALIVDKAKEVISEAYKVGEKTCEAHHIDNEELKRSIQEAIKKGINITIEADSSADFIEKKLEELSEEELMTIKAKIEELVAQKKEPVDATPSEEAE